jgi:hypothetical protein
MRILLVDAHLSAHEHSVATLRLAHPDMLVTADPNEAIGWLRHSDVKFDVVLTGLVTSHDGRPTQYGNRVLIAAVQARVPHVGILTQYGAIRSGRRVIERTTVVIERARQTKDWSQFLGHVTSDVIQKGEKSFRYTHQQKDKAPA